MDQQPKDTRSLGDLFAELSHETRQLVQQELQLARAEISEKVSQAGKGATAITAGGLVAYAGFLVLLASATFGLALVVDAWLAALIVGVFVVIIGLSVLASGREKLRAKNMTLVRTTETLQEDKKWIKGQMR